MSLKSFLAKLFKGYEVLETVNSPINGEIIIIDNLFGKKEMRIGGVVQSGGLVKKLWGEIFNQFLNRKNFRCLILGLGCGSAAKLISERFPNAEIVGVEIDPKVVEVGKKYFGLNSLKILEVVIGDAVELVQSSKTLLRGIPSEYKVQSSIQNSKFNLVLVDLYLGKEFSKEAESEEFIRGVRNLLSDSGMAIFNRLSYQEYAKPANEFAKRLSDFFPRVWTKKAATNLLIFCSQ